MLRDLAWQLQGIDAAITMRRDPVYVESERLAYVDTVPGKAEPWGWRNSQAYTFSKAFDWELMMPRPGDPVTRLPNFACFELKWLDADEFGHWSHTDFKVEINDRKRREWELFHALREGISLPEGGRAGGESRGAARRRTPPPHLRGATSRGERSSGDLTGALSRAARSRQRLRLPRHDQIRFDLDRDRLHEAFTDDSPEASRHQAHHLRRVPALSAAVPELKGLPTRVLRGGVRVPGADRLALQLVAVPVAREAGEPYGSEAPQLHGRRSRSSTLPARTWRAASGLHNVGRPSRFVRPRSGQAEMDRIFRYDRLDLLVDFLCEKVGEEVEVGSANTSPERSFSLSEECEIELRKFFAPEYRIYERAIGG